MSFEDSLASMMDHTVANLSANRELEDLVDKLSDDLKYKIEENNDFHRELCRNFCHLKQSVCQTLDLLHRLNPMVAEIKNCHRG